MENDKLNAQEIQDCKECITKEPQVGDLPWSIQAMIIDRLPTMTLLKIQAVDPQWWQSIVNHSGQVLTKPKQPLLIRWTDYRSIRKLPSPTSGFWVTTADFTGDWLFYQPEYLKNIQILTMDAAGSLVCCFTVQREIFVFNILTGCCKELPMDFELTPKNGSSDSWDSCCFSLTMSWDPCALAYQVVISMSNAFHIYSSITNCWKHYMDIPKFTRICHVFNGDAYAITRSKEMWKMDLSGSFTPCFTNADGCLMQLVTSPDRMLLVQSVQTVYTDIYHYVESVWEKLTEVPEEIMTIMVRSDPDMNFRGVSLSCTYVGASSLYLLSQCWTCKGDEYTGPYYIVNEVLISYELDHKEWKVLDRMNKELKEEKDNEDGNIETFWARKGLCGLHTPDFSIPI